MNIKSSILKINIIGRLKLFQPFIITYGDSIIYIYSFFRQKSITIINVNINSTSKQTICRLPQPPIC